MESLASTYEELDEDFLLALKFSEGVNQFGLVGCNDQEFEDYLLAVQLSEEFNQPAPGNSNGNDQLELDDDFLLALKLSEGYNQCNVDNGQLETDAAFARRLERELNGRGSFEESEIPGDESSMIDPETSANVALLREWCAGSQCQAAGLAGLFQHLNYLDEVMLCERSGLRFTTAVKSASNSVRRRTNSLFRRSSGTGYGNGLVSSSTWSGQVQSTKTHDSEVDGKTSAAFDFISMSLSEFTGDIGIGQGERIPVKQVISAMLDLSLFSETMEMFLRSDSIKDLAERLGVVISLLKLLKVISLQDEYRCILSRPRRLKRRTKGLKEIAQSLPGAAVTAVIVLEDEKEPKSQPLFDLLGRLKLQADIYLKGAKISNNGEFQVGEGAASITLCRHIVETHASMLSTMGPASSQISNSGKNRGAWFGPPFSSTTMAAPQNESLPNIPKAIDWSAAVIETHNFKKEAEKIVNPLPGRQLKLVRQITELTNLPEGIYVCVMDSRPDILKAVIVGPKDTPYEGGLFEFDILAPGDFPNNPPKVVLKTTGGGRVRFNPNLYADGKVCLSLINTWQGNANEKWVPGSSTLLQVLVSIQSMIFVECPYINEPGREGLGGELASEQHKEFVRANTIRWGMIDWLQDSSKRNGIWKNVIKSHFIRNSGELQQLIRTSAATNVGIWHFHGNLSPDTLVRKSHGGQNLEKEFDKCLSYIK